MTPMLQLRGDGLPWLGGREGSGDYRCGPNTIITNFCLSLGILNYINTNDAYKEGFLPLNIYDKANK